MMMNERRHSAQLHLDPSLEPSNMTGNEQFVFALHPHGILADYRILMDSVIHEYFPKVIPADVQLALNTNQCIDIR